MSSLPARRPRLLIVPGLRDSGTTHWQTWLQNRHRGSLRVQQDDWERPDLTGWAARIGQTLADSQHPDWIVAAHSFGCLTLARYLQGRRPGDGGARVHAALMAAPADPDKFACGSALPCTSLPVNGMLVSSDTDPWMAPEQAALWAQRWGFRLHRLGDAGHINIDSGHGPWPLAHRWVTAMAQQQARQQRPARADWREWSFAL